MTMPSDIRQTIEDALNLAGANAYSRKDIEKAGQVDAALQWLSQQPAAPPVMDYYIWWTSQQDCEVIEERDIMPLSIPDYIRSEYQSRLGRNGRGRLWVAPEINVKEIVWDETKPAAHIANSRAGIVIHGTDAHQVFPLPGFLTDMQLNFINERPQGQQGQE